MKTNTYTKNLRVLLAVVFGFVFSFATIVPTSAAYIVDTTTNTSVSNLGELLVLDGLFGDTETTNATIGGTSRIGELLVLSNLFGNNNTTLNNTTALKTGNVSNLGELLVLDGLFGDNQKAQAEGTTIGKTSRLGELIVLTGIFDNNGLNNDGYVTVVVQPGDTLSAIARNIAGDVTRVNEIANLNGIVNPNLIYVGQRLTVPVPRNTTTTGVSDLGELLVLDNLFGGDGSSTTFGNGNVSRIGELIILNSIFGDGTFNGF